MGKLKFIKDFKRNYSKHCCLLSESARNASRNNIKICLGKCQIPWYYLKKLREIKKDLNYCCSAYFISTVFQCFKCPLSLPVTMLQRLRAFTSDVDWLFKMYQKRSQNVSIAESLPRRVSVKRHLLEGCFFLVYIFETYMFCSRPASWNCNQNSSVGR